MVIALAPQQPLPPCPTVVVLRALPGLGDWLTAVPTLRALRLARPDARVHLVGHAATRPLVARFPELVDGFHVFPGWPGLPEQPVRLSAIPGFLAALQGLEADLAIQLHGSGEITNELIELFGARHVAGFFRAGDRCPEPSRFLTWSETEAEVRRGLRLLTLLGLPTVDARLTFPLAASADADAAAILRDAGIEGGFVAIHPGATRAGDRWPARDFVEVGRAVAADGWPIVVTGGPGEMTLTRSVSAGIGSAVDLGGRTSIDELGGILRRATLLVSSDTGVSQLADALRVRSVVVFANDDGARMSRWAPLDASLHHAMTGGGSSAASVAACVGRLLRTARRPEARHAAQSVELPPAMGAQDPPEAVA